MKKILFAMLVSVIISVSCNRQERLEQFHKFDNGAWERFEFVHFEFPVTDVKQSWDIYLVLRYNDDFAGRLLPLNIEMVTPSEDSRVKDYSLFLRSITNNEITGESRDSFYELKTLTHPKATFTETGICTFEIENLNPKYITQGVLEIGFVFEPVSD